MAADEQHRAPWWRDAVIYQVYMRSFADSDGDGLGDLQGIRQRLPHIAQLGADALWLTPFYRSPMADGGYDVADPCDIDPMFGTLADADALITDAHGLGLRVIVDIVPNHTSSAHRWFVEALASPPGSRARARYHFSPGRGRHGELPPNNWPSSFGGPAWTRTTDPADGTPGEWYLHLYAPEQPDLNWDNPEVQEEYRRVLRFWLDRGVDGFRIDVAHGMAKASGLPDVPAGMDTSTHGFYELPYYDQDEVHEIFRDWRALVDTYPGDRVLVGESWAPSLRRLANYVRSDELHQAFNFHYLLAPWDAKRLRQVIDETLETGASVGAPATWVLSNHDVTRVASRYGEGASGLRRARAAALLMLALPGSAYIYQGEELGLPEVTDLPEEVLDDPKWENSGHTDRGRDGCRVPLPWRGETPPFGFGPVGSTASWLPQPPGWRALSVEAQQADPHSTLSLYRAALRLRRAMPEARDGGLRWLSAPEGTLAFRRGGTHGMSCVVNLSGAAVVLPRDPEPSAGPDERTELWLGDASPERPLLTSDPVVVTDETVVLPPDTAMWW